MTENVRLRDLTQIRKWSVPALVATVVCAVVTGHFLAKVALSGDLSAAMPVPFGAAAVLLNAKELDRALREVSA